MMPDRYPRSLSCVMSLKDQVEKLYLCLNGFNDIPEELKEDWLEVVHVGENIGAVGRYTKLPEIDGHLISCDDDLIYPQTYVSDFLKRYEKEGACMLSHHGKVVKNNRIRNLSHCLRDSVYTGPLDIPGAGVLFVPFELNGWNKMVLGSPKNPTDIYVGCIAKKMSCRILSMAHQEGYLEYVDPPEGTTIWDQETQYQDIPHIFEEILNRI